MIGWSSALLALAGTTSANPPVESAPVCLGPLTYRSATVYAGSTDYYFDKRTGEQLRIRVSNLETEGSGFESLTALDDTEEGPPSENPAKVGLAFDVCFEGLAIKAVPAARE